MRARLVVPLAALAASGCVFLGEEECTENCEPAPPPPSLAELCAAAPCGYVDDPVSGRTKCTANISSCAAGEVCHADDSPGCCAPSCEGVPDGSDDGCGTRCETYVEDWDKLLDGDAGGPARRASFGFAFFPGDDPVVVLAGGRSHTSDQPIVVHGDTWLLRIGDEAVWQDLGAAGLDRPRHGAPLVFHPGLGRALRFSGFTGEPDEPALDDALWAFERTVEGGTWTRLEPAGTAPSPRGGHCAAYDPAHDELVIFGGSASPATNEGLQDVLDDTWVLTREGDAVAWVRKEPATSPPGGRLHAACAWDGEGVLLFGGVDDAGNRQERSWRWDGTTWTDVTTAGPSERHAPAMAWDEARGRVVLLGGYGLNRNLSEDTLDDVWLWRATPSGGSWLRADQTTPPARRAAGLVAIPPGVFEGPQLPADGGLLLFGGGSSELEQFADLWRLSPDPAPAP